MFPQQNLNLRKIKLTAPLCIETYGLKAAEEKLKGVFSFWASPKMKKHPFSRRLGSIAAFSRQLQLEYKG
jgi:hypothetical protein